MPRAVPSTSAGPDYYDRPDGNVTSHAGGEDGGRKPRKPVDVNVMKRNMSVAKGFMDISLLSANANQLRNLFNFGDQNNATYFIVLTGLLISLALQLVTGVLLVIKERYDLNKEEDHELCDRLNNLTVLFVFIVLLVNVFVSSFGVDVMNPVIHTDVQTAKIIHINATAAAATQGFTITSTQPAF